MPETAQDGAKSVADAVKRVADAAVAEAGKVKPEAETDFHFSATPGGRFDITGDDLGASGTVKVNGHPVETLSWSTTRIEGKMPKGTGSGEVTVQLDEKTVRKGRYKKA